MRAGKPDLIALLLSEETEDEVLGDACERAMQVHKMTARPLTPEFKQKIKGLIRSTSFSHRVRMHESMTATIATRRFVLHF
ncbi:MAG: hypothetical protein WBE34_15145 [Candidatus Nitrosopolaris sp.]